MISQTMRYLIGLLIITVAVLVQGQEIAGDLIEVADDEDVFDVIDVISVDESSTTSSAPPTTLSPEELREDDFNGDITYLFLIPKQFYVESKERICLLVTKCKEVLEYRVTLLMPNGNEYWSSGEKEAEQGEDCFEFDVPIVESGASSKLTVRLQLRRTGSEIVGDDGYEVTKERFVTVQTQGGQKTFVQTDKPIYQSGQIVRFRALTLNSELKTITDPFDSIVIENPSRQRINQWVNIGGEDGLVDLEHELPDEPPEGTYSIKVTRGNEQVTQTFTIEEYVLPRFEVEIINPPYILITDTNAEVKICATYLNMLKNKEVYCNKADVERLRLLTKEEWKEIKRTVGETAKAKLAYYTYGKPVQGSVEATITAGGGRYDYRTRTRTAREVLTFSIPETDANGCAVIDVDLKRLELTSRKFNAYGASLSTEATFTETATAETLKKGDRSTSASLSTSPFSLNSISEKNIYKPGLPLFGAVRVTYPDGSATPNESLVVRCNRFSSEVEVTSDEQGFAEYVFPVEADYTGFDSSDSLSCNVTSKSYPERFAYNSVNYTLTQPLGFLTLSPLYSPSDNYLDVEPVIRPRKAGQDVNLRVHMTTDISGGPRILAVSRGNIIQDFKFEADLQEEEDGTVYNVHFVLTPFMTPRLDLLVYGLLDDGEMIADSLEINSDAVFENQVNIQVADSQNAELEPGAQTSIKIVASPGSLCAVGVVDESVHLLGGDNQIKTSQVVSFLNTFQLSEGDSLNKPCQEAEFVEPTKIDGGGIEPFPQPFLAVEQPVRILARKKRQFGFFPPYSRDPYPLYTDVTREFEDLGLVRISNLNIETSPCEKPEPLYYPVFFERAFADFAVQRSSSAISTGPVIRSYFPETWLWHLQRSEDSPTVVVPDTITEWIGGGFCISSITGFGVSEPFTVNAFKPFFADYNLPYSVIRGEELELEINIFNYVDKCLPVEVTLTGSGEFDIVDNSNSKTTCVCSSSEPTQVTFNIRPLVLGDVDIETTVIVVYDRSICGTRPVEDDVTHSDGLRKPILVEPEGEEIEDSLNLYFCPSDEDGGTFRHTFDVTIPEEYVDDSGRVIIFLSGDILGNSLTNIDSLLRMPSGCGEQNMLGFVPNIYALQYLNATDQADQLQINKGLTNMRKGYQKQLNYRRRSGSYSAFGNSDAEGSAWLTAYVIRSFAQARQFIPIDESDLQVSIGWLINTLGQEANGCFRSKGRVIHKEMQGGVNDEVTLTAFILVSLLEARVSRDDPAVVSALFCVGNSLGSIADPNEETDTYSAALIAYALSIAKDPRVAFVMTYLESVAIDEGGVKYWVSNRAQTRPSGGYGHGATASSISIEMTGYVLLTYINIYGIDGVAVGSGVSKWLVSQQGPRGGFKSSQDTVVAIHALAEYAELVFGGETNLAVAVGYQKPCTLSSIFTIHSGNRLVLQRADLEHFPQTISVIAAGDGCALLQVIIRFNVHPKPPPEPPFTITYSVGPSQTGQPFSCFRRFNLNVCASYTGEDGYSNMAIVEVKLVTGYIPDPASLDRLTKGDLTMYEYRQKKVVLYFRQFTAAPLCFDLEVVSVHKVTDAKPGLITVYDYYDPGLTLATEYVLACLVVRPPPLPIEILPVEEGQVEILPVEEGQVEILPVEDGQVEILPVEDGQVEEGQVEILPVEENQA